MRTAFEQTDGAAAPTFKFVDDEYLEQLPPPSWLITDMLLTETVNHIIGAPGSFKSFFALSVAAHIRLDRPFHGRAVTGGPVLYVLAEGVRSFGLRVRAWKIHHNQQGPIGINFLMMPVQLAEENEVSALLKAVEQHGMAAPRLTIIDTQARCSIGLEENSNSDMGRLIAGAERIQRETGGAVAMLHHTPRDADRERGATAQRGGVDATLLVTADGDQVTVKIDRQKDGETGLKFAFQKRVIEIDDSGRTSCVLVPVTEAERQQAPTGVGDMPESVRKLLEALRGPVDGGCSTSQLRLASGLKERTYYLALANAKMWNLIDGTSRSLRITPVGRGLFV
jgi:hypothetical protein